MTQTSSTYALIGGSSGIGLALAQALTARGEAVLIGDRSVDRLAEAASILEPLATTKPVDITSTPSLAEFFRHAPPLSGLFCSGAAYRTSDFQTDDHETTHCLFEAKFWSQYNSVKAALPHLTPSAAIVLMPGAASARPVGSPAYAACNAAVEGLVRGLALELHPIRVNALAPGTTDSPLWRNRPASQRDPAFKAWESLSLVGRPATVEEEAHAALFLLDNTNMTASTLYCDGGYVMR